MSSLLPIPLRMLLCMASTLALTSLVPGTSAAAQPTYRCIDDDGRVVIGNSQPGDVSLPANCRKNVIPVSKAVTPKDLEAVKQYLSQRITDLALRESRCRAAHGIIEVEKDDALDAIDSLADNRPNGRVSRAERRVAGKIDEDAKRAHVSSQQCVQRAQAESAQLKAILSSPERLSAEAPEWLTALKQDHQLAEGRRETEARDRKWRNENILRAEQEMREAAEAKEAAQRQLAERLSEGLREQLLSILENARGAHEMFLSGASYDAFYLRLEAIGKQIQDTRRTYARQLQIGDHKLLSMAVYTAYDALSAAFPYWRKERGAAETLATAEMNAARSGAISNPSTLDRSNADENKRRLREAQQQYADTKTQLAASRDVLTQLMSETIRVAKGEREKSKRANVEASNP
jgi:hypothetical protein